MIWGIVALGLAATAPAAAAPAGAGTPTLRYATAPAWLAPPPVASDAATPPGAAARVVYADQQVRIGPGGQEVFQDFRVRILSPEALGVGNITATWSPATEEMVVHRLQIIRDGVSTDVLASQKLAIIQRENNLDQAMLDGNLTATVQVAGLQVGDDLEFAATKITRTTAYDPEVQGFMQFPVVGARGAYRLRVLQPTKRAVAYRASPNVPSASAKTVGGETERRWELADPASAIIPDDAPPRYAVTRLVQYSSYADWPAVSRTFERLFETAEVLSADSPVKAEATRIAATTSDPLRRAEAALRTVEDRIRYVYVGLDGGNYRPAQVDETWRRRFGDCKAKTVLLIALLRELGIPAEGVLVAVDAGHGDGADERLPTPAVFNHVVARATIGGVPYWLDGTRIGDRSLAELQPPLSRWGLPLSPSGAALERIPAAPPRRPNLIQVIDIDASAGFDKPGRYHVQNTLRGDEIFAVRAQLAGVAAADADRLLAGYWRKQIPGVEPSHTAWRFDEDNRLLVLSMEGEGKVDWEGDDKQGHTYYLAGAGFTPPPEAKRPKEEAQDAAWASDYPAFNCYATTVKVPPAGRSFAWSYLADPVSRTLGGVEYWRVSSFSDRTIRTVMSRRVDVWEISANEARAVNDALPKFDNNKSYVFETDPKSAAPARGPPTPAAQALFGSFEAFAGPDPPCQAPARP